MLPAIPFRHNCQLFSHIKFHCLFLSGPDFSTTASGYTKEIDEILKRLSPQMMSFITNLPAIEGMPQD